MQCSVTSWHTVNNDSYSHCLLVAGPSLWLSPAQCSGQKWAQGEMFGKSFLQLIIMLSVNLFCVIISAFSSILSRLYVWKYPWWTEYWITAQQTVQSKCLPKYCVFLYDILHLNQCFSLKVTLPISQFLQLWSFVGLEYSFYGPGLLVQDINVSFPWNSKIFERKYVPHSSLHS